MKAFGDWSNWQFLGLYGVIEASVGLAAIIAPNVWRLPVAQLNTNESTDVELSASTTFIPHWSGVGRSIAGISMIVIAAAHEGVAVSSISLLPFLMAMAFSVFAVSAMFAYAGVTHTDFDVIQIVFRHGSKESALPAFSLGASIMHLLINVLAMPIVILISPGILFKPEMSIGAIGLVAALLLSAALGLVGTYLWRKRISWKAPRAQQVEAEKAI